MILLANSIDVSAAVFMAVLLLTCAVLLYRTQRYFAKPNQGNAIPVEPAQPPSQRPRGHEFGRWEVEMHELARDLSARLDTKLGVLQQMIHEADRAAARLEAALADARQPSASPTPPTDALDAVPTSQAEALLPAPGGTTGDTRPRPAADDVERRDSAGRYEEIYLLSDYGYDAAEIAHRVGSPLGEVQLILDLRTRR